MHKSPYYPSAFQKSGYQQHSHINKNTCAGSGKGPIYFNCSTIIAPNCYLGKSIKKDKYLQNSLSAIYIEGFPQPDAVFYFTVVNRFLLHNFESHQNPDKLLVSVHSVARSFSA